MPDIADDLAALAEDNSRIQTLIQVLGRLSTPEQEVIQWCVIRGFPANVVADVTGEAPGTVRSRLSRALGEGSHGLCALNTDDMPRRTIRSRT